MKYMFSYPLFALVICASLVTGCGGGGSSKSAQPSNVTSKPTSSAEASSQATSSAAPVDKEAPSVPTAINKTSATKDAISISWSAASDNLAVSQYRVYRNSALVATVDANQLNFSDTSLKNNTIYNYSVSAGDAAGNWSEQATAVSIKTARGVIQGSASFEWAPPAKRENNVDLSTTEIGGYEVRYKLKEESDYVNVTVDNPNKTTQTLDNLSGEYDFEIAVYDVNELYSSFAPIEPI